MDDNKTNTPDPQDDSAQVADAPVVEESNTTPEETTPNADEQTHIEEPDINPAEEATAEPITDEVTDEAPAPETTQDEKQTEAMEEETPDDKTEIVPDAPNLAYNDLPLGEPVPAAPVEKKKEPKIEDSPEETAAGEEEAKAEEEVKSPGSDNPNAKWYVVHTFAGHENRVAATLRQRIEAEHLENKIFDILVPTQDKIEIRSGKKETVKEKIFPGYILVKMDLDDISWLAVRTTQGVTSFVGMSNKPTPISEREVSSIVKFTQQGAQPTFKDVFMVDDTIKIIDGPFAEFIGKVDSVDKEKGRVRVLVSIFGRETPVELDFLQVQKL